MLSFYRDPWRQREAWRSHAIFSKRAYIANAFPGLGIASVAFVCYVIYDNMTSKESLEKAKHEADQRSLLSSGGGLLKEISKEVTQSKSH